MLWRLEVGSVLAILLQPLRLGRDCPVGFLRLLAETAEIPEYPLDLIHVMR
jgi:hypothetical protein